MSEDSEYSINSDEEIKSLTYRNLIPNYYRQDFDNGTTIEYKIQNCPSFDCKFKQRLNKMHSIPTETRTSNIVHVAQLDESYFNNKSDTHIVKVHLAQSRRNTRNSSVVPTISSATPSQRKGPSIQRRKSRGQTYNNQKLESTVQRNPRAKKQIYVTQIIPNHQNMNPVFRHQKYRQSSVKPDGLSSNYSTPKSILKSNSSSLSFDNKFGSKNSSLKSINTPSQKKVKFEFTKDQIQKLKKIEILAHQNRTQFFKKIK